MLLLQHVSVTAELTFEAHLVAQDLQKLLEQQTVFTVVQDLLFSILILLYVYDTHLQFRLYENLQKTESF